MERVEAGLKSQDVVAMGLRKLARQRGDSLRILGVASAGQHANDLEISYAGRKLFVEIKGVRSVNAELVLLERSVRRDNVPTVLNDTLRAIARHADVGGARMDSLLRAAGVGLDFLSVMDFFRDNFDPSVGLSEDKNSPPSGKIPRELSTSSRVACEAVRRLVVKKLSDEGNSYVGVHDKSDDRVYIYHTGLGQNPIGADPLPRMSRVRLDTYGGSSRGATRVAVKSLVHLT